MERRDLQRGDVVQLDPAKVSKPFAGCFMLVTEPKSFGAQGVVYVPAKDGPGFAYYRATFDAMEYIGSAAFVSAEA